MQPPKQFDYDTFVRGFRAACARRGIDPLEGATLYQVVRVRAEAAQSRPTDRWWQRHALWVACEPYRSDVEEEVFWSLFLQAYLPVMGKVAAMVALHNARLKLREVYEHVKEREFHE